MSTYCILRKILVKTMMERESFGDLVIQVLSNLREDMQRNLKDMEGVLDMASPARDENPREGEMSLMAGV